MNEIWLPPDPGPGPVSHQLFGEIVHNPSGESWNFCSFGEGRIIAVWAITPRFGESALKFGVKGADGSVTVLDATACKFGSMPNEQVPSSN